MDPFTRPRQGSTPRASAHRTHRLANLDALLPDFHTVGIPLIAHLRACGILAVFHYLP